MVIHAPAVAPLLQSGALSAAAVPATADELCAIHRLKAAARVDRGGGLRSAMPTMSDASSPVRRSRAAGEGEQASANSNSSPRRGAMRRNSRSFRAGQGPQQQKSQSQPQAPPQQQQKSSPQQQPQQRMRTACRRGKMPNIYWRSISIDELRTHPRVLSLPPVPSITLAGPATYRWVRQDDPLWEDLHTSVLTSRHLLAVLGFREPRAARILGLNRAFVSPNALVDSYYHFRQTDSRGYSSIPGAALRRPGRTAETKAAHANEALRSALHSFYQDEAKWPPSESERLRDLRSIRVPRSIGELRCCWGSAQEATALASLLDAVRDGIVEEIGLSMLLPEELPSTFPAEIRRLAENGGLPPIGASPDGMLRRGDASKLEAVEVKNHCPYFVRRGLKKGRGGQGRTRSSSSGSDASEGGALSDTFHVWAGRLHEWERERLPWFEQRGPLDAIPPQYVPQVQLECLCTGADFNNFVSASACQGVNIFRAPRDDAYLGEMLYFISKFWSRVINGKCPSVDLHWQDGERYEAFLHATVRIGREAALDKHVRQPWRRPAKGLLGSFFLDEWIELPP